MTSPSTLRSGRLLLDCGWDDEFDPAALEALREVAPSIDAVLLSHGDLAHLGALPYARANLGPGVHLQIVRICGINQMLAPQPLLHMHGQLATAY